MDLNKLLLGPYEDDEEEGSRDPYDYDEDDFGDEEECEDTHVDEEETDEESDPIN